MKKSDSNVGKSYRDLVESKFFSKLRDIAQSLAIVMLVFMVWNKDVITVVVPWHFNFPIEIDGDVANEAYQAGHAWTLAALLGNLNNTNATFITNQFVKMLSPFLQSQLESSLEAEASILKLKGAKQSFQIKNMMFSEKYGVTFVWGEKTLTSRSGKKNTTTWTFEFKIEPNGAMPRVVHYNAYEGIPKIKSEPEYVINTKPYLTDELFKAKMSTDPKKAVYKEEDTK